MTTIEWTRGPNGEPGESWNPVVGCTRVSAGCDNCYAMGQAHRGMSPQHRGLTKLRGKDAARPGVDWTGEVRFVPSALAKPLHWRKPRRVFVNSMSDLFHGSLPFEQIAAVFGVMAATPRHTYQVLTKRPGRAREFFAWLNEARKFTDGSSAYTNADYCGGSLFESAQGFIEDRELLDLGKVCYVQPWPLPNVHLGVSVEDKATADERIPLLLQTPAAVRWVSYEPALGPVDFRRWLPHEQVCTVCTPTALDWIVVGGESGPGARPFDLAWARSVIEQGRAAGVPVFVKQLGWTVMRELGLRSSKGGDPSEWSADLRVREYPEAGP